MERSGSKGNGTKMRPSRKPLSAAALLGALLVGPLGAQSDVIRVDVNLVPVIATVKDANGALVGSLEKNDFQIRDNGVPQRIEVFERRTEQPLAISLLIDNSGSTAKDLKYEIESIHKFLDSYFREGNPEDALALYTFNWEVRQLVSFTRNRFTIEQHLRGIKGEAGTSLYDAIYLASRDLDDRDGRKVMIIVTDGGDTISSKDFDGALRAAQLADAVIYPILVVPIQNDAGRNTGGENALTTIAQRTGGRVFTPSIGATLDAAFTDLLRELRTQYLIGFYPKDVPPTDDPFHRLDITVRGSGLRVFARSGYYGQKGGASAPARRVTVTPKR
jgi:Ca-activated chloride channel homolog